MRKQRVVRSRIPPDILENIPLNHAIGRLPPNYNFEIHKTVWRIREVSKSQLVRVRVLDTSSCPSCAAVENSRVIDCHRIQIITPQLLTESPKLLERRGTYHIRISVLCTKT